MPEDVILTQSQVALVQSDRGRARLACLAYSLPPGHRGHVVWVGGNLCSLIMDLACCARVPVREWAVRRGGEIVQGHVPVSRG